MMRDGGCIFAARDAAKASLAGQPVNSLDNGHAAVPQLACSLVEALLELKPHPTFIVDVSGRVVAANAAARGLAVDAPTWLSWVGGELRCRIVQLPALMRELMASTTTARTRVMMTPNVADEQQALVVVSTLVADQFKCGDSGACADEQQGQRLVLVSLHVGQSRRSRHDPQVLVDTFGLTPTEARIALDLLDGQSPKDVAMASGQKVSTMRWHLRNVLSKTGCAKRSDLIRALVSIYYL